MRKLACALTGLILSSNALAGGVGLLATGGAYGDRIYFYDGSEDPPVQYRMGQTLGVMGGGVELLLGNKDDRFIGTFKGYGVAVTPEKDPAEHAQSVSRSDVIAAPREEWAMIGMGTVGFQAGIVGDPRGARLVASFDIGSGFLTRDHAEFFYGAAGVGGTIALPMQMQVYALAQYNVRYRKYFRHGGQATVGVRYMFD